MVQGVKTAPHCPLTRHLPISLCLSLSCLFLSFLSLYLANAVGATDVVGVEKSLTYEASCSFLVQTKCISSAQAWVAEKERDKRSRGKKERVGGVRLLDLAGPTGAAAANAQTFLSVLFASCSCTHSHTHTHAHTYTHTQRLTNVVPYSLKSHSTLSKIRFGCFFFPFPTEKKLPDEICLGSTCQR